VLLHRERHTVSFPVDPASWPSTLVWLLPLALAARSRSRAGGRKPPPPPPPAPKRRPSWRLPLLLAGVALVLVLLGVWAARGTWSPPSQQPSEEAQGRSILETPGVSKEQFRAQVEQLCPRFAAISWGQAERPSRLAAQLISMECMSHCWGRHGDCSSGSTGRSAGARGGGRTWRERGGASPSKRGLVEEVEAEARARDKPVLGARAVRAQHPHTRPEQLKRSPRPLGHASTRQAPRELSEQYRAFVAAFQEAAARWRRGDFSANFPLYPFPPRVLPGRVAQIL